MEDDYRVYVQELTAEEAESFLSSYMVDDDLIRMKSRCIVESWNLALLAIHHRENGPALMVREVGSDRVVLEEWFRYGARHRVGGPSRIERSQGRIEARWYQNDKLHRLDGPAIQYCGEQPVRPLREEWFKAGMRHREDGPAVIWTDHDTGIRIFEEWHLNDVPHRIGGPQYIERDDVSGIAINEQWYVHGKAHRLDGPPVVYRDRFTGEIRVDKEYPGPTNLGVPIATDMPKP